MVILRKILPLLGAVLWLGMLPLRAQDEETPEQKQYREDFELYQKIAAIPAASKRAEGWLQFLQDRPKSQIVAKVQYDYLLVVQDWFKQSKWEIVVPQMERFLKLRPKAGEGYYFLGAALKEQKKLPEAMNALAKCYVLRCPASQKARQFLEVIYKGANKGSTAGLDALIEKARKEVGG